MRKLKKLTLAGVAILVAALTTSVSNMASAAEIFGTYNNGCIRGASALEESPYLQVLRYAPERAYAHPELIKFINDLARKAVSFGLPPLLIGDLSKHYGGTFGRKSAHGSHQIGLDADVSFDFASPRRSQSELANPRDLPLVDAKGRPTRFFDTARAKLILLAASDPRVERIFVAPGIKKRMCELLSAKAQHDESIQQALRRLRPWFGHRAHMHVRLGCPVDSPWCIHQAAVPPGDGCGAELQSWFEPPKPGASSNKPKPAKKELPVQCKAVLAGH